MEKKRTLNKDLEIVIQLKFTTQQNLVEHKNLIHKKSDNNKQYKCGECDKTFTTKKYLKQHSRCHDSARPIFRCNFCHKPFQTKSGVDKHYNSKHNHTLEEINTRFGSSTNKRRRNDNSINNN